METLYIEGLAWRNGTVVEFLKKMLGLGNFRALILSRSAVMPYLSTLTRASGHYKTNPTTVIQAQDWVSYVCSS